MFFFKRCYVNTTEETDVISVIHELRYAIRDSKGPEGLLTAITPRPGAGFVIMSLVPELVDELKASFEVFGSEAGVSKDGLKREFEVGPHIQAAILGRTVHIPFQEGRLLIDPYDDVLLVDFEHKRARREFIVQVISETPAAEAGQKVPVGRVSAPAPGGKKRG